MNRCQSSFCSTGLTHFIRIFFILICILLLANCTGKKKNTVYEKIDSVKIAEAFKFCKKKGFDTSTAFFVDMSIHSGKNRFFVWNFRTKKIMYEGVCCHGIGKGSTASTPMFSNKKGSRCTALGKYKTGIRSYSQWGINVHYKLYGLGSSNSNAYKRAIVLHSHSPVTKTEVYPFHIPMGWSHGCPIVSDALMHRIDALLKSKTKPTLLWIYQ